MDILQHLAIALGLGTLAGVNLYLTVFLTGMAIRFDVLQLAAQHSELAVLGNEFVLAVAGVLFVVELVADKVPWVDSLWDSVHTVVRPAGAVLIALPALGTLDAPVAVAGALMAGAAALTTHGAKASTRLIVNASPEPVSNFAVSVAEDVAVVGLLTLMAFNPIISGIVCLIILVGLWFFMPVMLRGMRANAWLALNKLKQPGHVRGDDGNVVLPDRVTAEEDILLNGQLGPARYTVAWSIPCLSGRAKKIKGLPSNLFGALVATHEHTDKVVFLGKRLFGRMARVIELDGCSVSHESRILSENLVIYCKESKRQAAFRFKRGDAKLVEAVAADLERRLLATTPTDPPEELALPEDSPAAKEEPVGV